MYSFYGGRPGNSFVITKTYTSYEDMIADFSSNNCNVHYDEHVLINCSNRNNDKHGNIYRRGYNQNNGEAGAELIGNIAGPAGPPPDLRLINYTDIPEQLKNNLTVQNGNLDMINGATYSKPQWYMYQETAEDNSNKTVYMNLQIPYPVFDFDVATVSPYKPDDGSTIYDGDGSLSGFDPSYIEQIIDPNNPFIQKWKFHIPAGLNGSSLSNFNMYPQVDEQTNKRTGSYIFSYVETPANLSPITKEVRIGPFRNIEEVVTNPQNTVITLKLSDDTEESFSIVPQDGIVENLRFQNGVLSLKQKGVIVDKAVNIPTISGISITEDKKIRLNLVNGDTITTTDTIKDNSKIKELNITNDGILQVLYEGQSWSNLGQINKISDIKIQNQKIYIQRNNSNNWINLGAPYELPSSVNTIENVDWIGLGKLTKVNESTILEFYLPLNTHIPTDKQVTINRGLIQYEYNYTYVDEDQNIQERRTNTASISAFSSTTIEKNTTGLYIKVASITDNPDKPIDNGVSWVPIQITNLQLTLSPIVFNEANDYFAFNNLQPVTSDENPEEPEPQDENSEYLEDI